MGMIAAACPECGGNSHDGHYENCAANPNPVREVHETMFRLGAEAALELVRENTRWLNPDFPVDKVSAKLWLTHILDDES